MKTDRELLEKAAKAAGITFDVSGNNGGAKGDAFDVLGNAVLDWHNNVTWNPLQDDGDALRLAVKLNIEFACFDDMEQVNAGVWVPGPESWNCMTPYNGDKRAAVRRAITLAAAEIQLNKENR